MRLPSPPNRVGIFSVAGKAQARLRVSIRNLFLAGALSVLIPRLSRKRSDRWRVPVDLPPLFPLLTDTYQKPAPEPHLARATFPLMTHLQTANGRHSASVPA